VENVCPLPSEGRGHKFESCRARQDDRAVRGSATSSRWENHAEDSRAQRIGALCCGHAMMSQSDPGLNEPAAAPPRKFMPSMNQIAGVPLSFCHRMSDLLSPL
jgi:hypothetical protein